MATHRDALPAADRRATWLELFFDLVFAAAIADAGAAFAADYSFAGLIRFTFPFGLIWWAWAGHTYFATRFDSDDALQRLSTLGQVFFVAVMAINTEIDMGSREVAGFAAAYAAMRLLLVAQYLRVVGRPATRRFVLRQIAGIGAAAAVWLSSAVAPPPLRYALWAVAVAAEFLTPLVARRSGAAPIAHPAHLPERFGLFTLIFLGESVVGVMAGMRHQDSWTAAAAGSAVLGMGLTFALWWGYFDVAAGPAPRVHPMAVAASRLRRWTAAHWPLCFGIAVGAVGIEQVIHLGGVRPLGGTGAALLAGAVVVSVLALGVIAGTADRDERSSTPAWPKLGLPAIGGALLALAAKDAPPVWLLAGLTAVAVGAVAVAARSGRRVRARSTP